VPDDDFKARLEASRKRQLERSRQAITPAKPPADATAAKPIARKEKKQAVVAVQSEAVPHNNEAEQGILGSMLSEPEKALAVIAQKRFEAYHFFNPAHRTIFKAFVDMFDSGAKQINIITFGDYLDNQKLSAEVGGRAYITQLFALVPTSAAVEYYIDIVFEKFVRRRMIGFGATFARAAYGITQEDAIDLLSKFAGQYEQIFDDARQSGIDDAAHLLNGQTPDVPVQIVRRIVHRGSKLIVGGGSKTQKTWALMDLALSISTGSDWWGFRTSRARVCYINLELQDWSFHERLVVLAEKKGVKPDEGWLKILNLRGHAQSIEQLRSRFSLMLKSGYFSLVIIDPVYKVLGGRRDENKAGDIATMLNEVDKIAVRANVAVAMAAHFSKGNQAEKDHVDRIGGSGVFARDPDSILTMTAHEDADCFTVETTLRNLPPLSQFVVRWEYPMFMRDEEKNPQALKGGRPPDTKKEKHILDQMSVVKGWKAPELQKEMIEKDITRPTFYRLLNKLFEAGKIEKKDDGLWYRASLKKTSETNETNETEQSQNSSET
jgi:hypothetical protein